MLLESEYGSIEYRFPTIPEGLRLMSKLGASPEEAQNVSLDKIATMIEMISTFVVRVSLEVDGVKALTYEEALTHFEFAEMINELVGKIFNSFNTSSKKKVSLPN